MGGDHDPRCFHTITLLSYYHVAFILSRCFPTRVGTHQGDTTQSSCDTTQSSCDTTQSSCQTMQSSCYTTQSSCDTTQTSCDTMQSASQPLTRHEIDQMTTVFDQNLTKFTARACSRSLYQFRLHRTP